MDVQNQEPLANMTSNEDKVTYRDSTYEIVSKVAYLLGVPKRIFENEHEAPKLEVYEKLEQEKAARIIRHLCIIRTAIERNFKHINGKMVSEYRSILSMPEYIPPESIEQLRLDGVSFFKNSSKKLYQHIVEINRLISDRINNCKKYFPLWLNWQYVKELFNYAGRTARKRNKGGSFSLLSVQGLLSISGVYELGSEGRRQCSV